jgi:hypothetical protein
MGCLPSLFDCFSFLSFFLSFFFLFFGGQWVILIGPSQPFKSEIWETPQNSNFNVTIECLPFCPHIGENGENFKQRIWDFF